jgi:hypothetical protein
MELLSAFCICNTASGNMGCGYNPLQKKKREGYVVGGHNITNLRTLPEAVE